MRDKSFEHIIEAIDKQYSKILLVILVFGMSIAIYLQRVDIIIRGSLLFIPISVALVLIRRSFEIDCTLKFLQLEKTHLITLSLAFFIILTTSNIILSLIYYRDLTYFVLISLAYILIILQALVKQNEKMIILQVNLWILSLTLGVTARYPLFYSGTDIFGHMDMTSYIVEKYHVQNITSSYYHFPLYHILNAIIVEICDISVRISIDGVMPTLFIICMLQYFVFIKNIVKNDDRVAILSYILILSSLPVLWYAQNAITRTMAFCLFLGWFLTINKNNSKYYLMFILLLIATIIMHQASMILFTFFLLLLYISVKIIDRLSSESSNALLFSPLKIILILVSFVTYWLFVGTDFLTVFVNTFTRPELVLPSLRLNIGSRINQAVDFLYSNIFYAFTTFFTILGYKLILYNYKSIKKEILTIALLSVIFLPIYIKGPLYILAQTRYVFQLDRLAFISSIAIVPIMTYGLIYLINSLNSLTNKKIKFIFTLVVLIMFVYIFLVTTNPSISTDYNKNTERNFFNSDEVLAIKFAEKNIEKGYIYSDWHVRRYFRFKERDLGRQIEIPIKEGSYTGLLLLRIGELKDRGLQFQVVIKGIGYSKLLTFEEIKDEINNLEISESAIYTNGNNKIFYVLT